MKIWTKSLIATLFMALIIGLAKVIFNAPPPAEMLFNFVGQLLGVPWIFNVIHNLPWGLDHYAKYVLYATTVLMFLGFWFVIGLLYPKFSRFPYWGKNLLLVAAYVLSVALVLFPIQGLGVFGLSDNNFLYPPLKAHLWAFLFALSFVLPLYFLSKSEAQPAATDKQRRESLRIIMAGAGFLAAGSLIGKIIIGTLARAQDLLLRLNGISTEVTPTEDHYVVSKNVFNPTVVEKDWSLKITGLVANPLTFTLTDLKNLPSVTRTSTLTCISNLVGGDLIGNSEWTGVKLKDILEIAGVKEGANELILKGADNYSDSFSLDDALRDSTIIAYFQNGEPLTVDHGFPARILVPGIYGMKNVKWVLEIELSDQDFQGYWQTRGWSDSAVNQIMSRIDTTEAVRLEDGRVAIGGIAFAGLKGISKVEVSLDGETWQEAQVKPPLNDISWNLWSFAWQAETGKYEVMVRATDGTGQLQIVEKNPPLPNGSTGYHLKKVKVI